MTEALFRDDAYLKDCEATVVSAVEGGVVMNRTVFYPMGGGQPGVSFEFLRRQFLQDGELPFTNVMSRECVDEALGNDQCVLERSHLHPIGNAVGISGSSPKCRPFLS